MKTVQVFVSHTSEMARVPEGRSFVQAVLDGIGRAGMAAVDMRYFPAWEGMPAEYCRARVRACEIYAAVVGFRYGSFAPGEAVSYTELEFDAAGAAGMPRLVFLLEDTAGLPGALVDTDRGPVERFRQRLRDAGLIVGGFTSADGLELQVYHALQEESARTGDAGMDDGAAHKDRAAADQRRPTLGMIADHLAASVTNQWLQEVAARRLNDPYPMPVRWEPADEWLSEPWERLRILAMSGAGWIASPSSWAPGPGQLAGEGNQLADILERVPTGRLMVLGEPGSGKTMLMVRLVLDLLARRSPGAAVPILISMASWDPRAEELHRWMAGQLGLTHAVLSGQVPGGRTETTRIEALINAGLIMPILDGLDEIAAAARGVAIAKIDAALRPGQRFVATSRTGPYREAVRPATGAGASLHAAAVELRPLTTAQVVHYLTSSAYGPAAVARWDCVATALDRPGPLTETLTVPLMAGLARAMYNPQAGEQIGSLPDPAELCSICSAPAIRGHLLNGFIAAAYPATRSEGTPWTRGQAERWLRYLARRVPDPGDIKWWEFQQMLPRFAISLSFAITLALVAGFGYGPPIFGFGAGILVGLPVGVTVDSLWLKHRRSDVVQGVIGGMAGALAGGAACLAIFGPGLKDYNLGAFLIGGLAIGVPTGAPLRNREAGAISGLIGIVTSAVYQHAAATSLAWSASGAGSRLLNGLGIGLAAFFLAENVRAAAPARSHGFSPAWSAVGVACGMVLGVVVWLQSNVTAGLIFGSVSAVAAGLTGLIALSVATDLDQAGDPVTVLRGDRRAFLESFLGFGTAIGLITALSITLGRDAAGQKYGIPDGVEIGITNLVILGLALGFTQAMWGKYIIARCWLAWSGRLPQRLMGFLEDAHATRGVLMQFGSVYQFRHQQLRESLIE